MVVARGLRDSKGRRKTALNNFLILRFYSLASIISQLFDFVCRVPYQVVQGIQSLTAGLALHRRELASATPSRLLPGLGSDRRPEMI